MRTLHGSSTLLAELLAVTGVTLHKVEESLDRTLVILVALHLNDHLLQAPDGLLTALLRHLALEVVVELVATGASLLLILLGNLGSKLLLALLQPGLSIESSVGAGLALVGTELSGITGIARSLGVSSLVSITNSLLDILLANGHPLLDGVLEVVLGEVGVLVPSVVLSGLVNLLESLLRGSDLVGGVLSSIASNVAEEGTGVGQKLPELTVGDQQCAQGTQSIESFVSVLLSGLLIDRRAGEVLVSTGDLLSVPDEVLEKVALVLG